MTGWGVGRTLTFAPALCIVGLFVLTLIGPGTPEIGVVLALAALQVAFLGVAGFVWIMRLLEAAAGVGGEADE